jgi:eukaryotic-like serine/threonine-protein kinase
MNSRTPDPPAREQHLDEILANYLKDIAAGQAPCRDTLLNKHPDFVSELNAFLDDRERFDRLAAPLRRLTVEPAVLPANVNDYELESEIAQGGMGIVWKARQRKLNRTVALKMLRTSAFTGAMHLQRFQAEAEAAGALDHPRIVPVYEVGEYQGQPYLVMKYLEGGNLADSLPRFRGAVRESAQLLVEIAEAVHYAHQHGVLHRDLKPANILLDGDGRPHVSDFGLAKRLPTTASENQTAGLTRTGDLVGTPSYMAPEQARGDQHAVTVATDVYGLGAILYELLTGQPPFRGEGILDTLNRIRDQAPVSPRYLQPGVSRDLETICLKALEKEPEQRYPGVRAMADDLRRYLAGEPVLARPVGRVVRVWRWCRRRPAIAALIFALAVAVVGGLAAVTWQWRRVEKNFLQAETNFARAEQERDRAAANLRQSEESFLQAHEVVNEFCVRLSDNQLNALSGAQPLRRDLLEAGLKYYQQFLTRKGDDPGLRTELAGIHRRLGLINASIGKRDEARTALEQSRQILEEQTPDSPQLQGDLGRTYLSIGLLQLSNGHLAAALASFEEAEKRLKVASEALPAEGKDAADYASVLLDKGLLCVRLGKLEEGRACYNKQIALLSQLAARTNNAPSVVTDLAAGHLNLGNLQMNVGKRPEAIASFEKARALLEPSAQLAEASDRCKNVLATCLIALGGEQHVDGQEDTALSTLDSSRVLLEKLTEANPDVLQYARNLSSCLRQSGHVFRVTRRSADALKCYSKARELAERLVRLDSASGELQNDLAKCLFDLAGLQCVTGKEADGLAHFQQSAALREKLVASEPDNLFYHNELGLTLTNIALGLARQGHLTEALEAAQKGIEQQRVAYTGAPSVAIFRLYLAGAYSRLTDLSLANKDSATAVGATRERRDLYPSDGAKLYVCATDFARAATLARKKDAKNPSNDIARAKEYDAFALETFRQAVHAGFKNATRVREDTAWIDLRSQPDFEKLLAECGK